MGVELLDSSGEIVAEVFRSDREKTVVESVFGVRPPDDALELMRSRASQDLDPFEDGTPLDQALRREL
jgi:hypothetical protein